MFYLEMKACGALYSTPIINIKYSSKLAPAASISRHNPPANPLKVQTGPATLFGHCQKLKQTPTHFVATPHRNIFQEKKTAKTTLEGNGQARLSPGQIHLELHHSVVAFEPDGRLPTLLLEEGLPIGVVG